MRSSSVRPQRLRREGASVTSDMSQLDAVSAVSIESDGDAVASTWVVRPLTCSSARSRDTYSTRPPFTELPTPPSRCVVSLSLYSDIMQLMKVGYHPCLNLGVQARVVSRLERGPGLAGDTSEEICTLRLAFVVTGTQK